LSPSFLKILAREISTGQQDLGVIEWTESAAVRLFGTVLSNSSGYLEMDLFLGIVPRMIVELTPLNRSPVAFQVFHPGQGHGRRGKGS